MACSRAAASHAAANIAKEETINHPRDYEYESIGPKGVAVSDVRLIFHCVDERVASVVRARSRIEVPKRLVGFAFVFVITCVLALGDLDIHLKFNLCFVGLF